MLEGNSAVALECFDPVGIKHGVFSLSHIVAHIIKRTKEVPEQSEVEEVVSRLTARGLIEPIDWPPGSSSSADVNADSTERHFVTTGLGKKAARLCRIMAGELMMPNLGREVGGTATSGQELEDLIVRACYAGNSEIDHIAIACCCATPEEISRSVARLVEGKYIRQEPDGKIKLLPTGVARGARLEETDVQGLVGKLAKEIAEANSPAANTSASKGTEMLNRFDVVIICALHDTELEQLVRAGNGTWDDLPPTSDDPSSYRSTTYVTGKGKRLRVVVGALSQMGMPASAVLATKMILRFRPRLVAMVGIAAGAKSEQQGFGDILVPDITMDYGSGKLTRSDGKLRFVPDPRPLRIQARLLARLKDWSTGRQLDDIRHDWSGPRTGSVLRMHIGALGSGSAVVDASEQVEEILGHWRKLVGIEMEAYGVHLACEDAVEPPPMFLCMKSISDFAVNKADGWRDYAAFTASQLCYRFLVSEWEKLFPE
jgi:nucleoside phosphorylase